ncbi:hypothetical protein WJX75_001672 [Coccomyxa subellipsoidea]|uniref:Uncharacterized protein n=1 Tax=Coccomyxa subellipsoidea TaxID=248742 RepID=A0ABR2YWA2_9CHLO
MACQARFRDQDDTSMALPESQQTQRRRITRRNDAPEHDRPSVILETFADLEDEDLCGHARPQYDDAPLNMNITGVEPSRLARTQPPAHPPSALLHRVIWASTNAALMEKTKRAR